MTRKLYCYCITPIDYWEGAQTMEQALTSDHHGHGSAGIALELCHLVETARAAFDRIGWEGDIRNGPYFFAVPDEVEMRRGVAWKQENNGTTFVASPVPMPWLDEHISAFDRAGGTCVVELRDIA